MNEFENNLAFVLVAHGPGMGFIALFLLSLGLSTLFGWAAILCALLRNRRASTQIASACILLSLVSTLVFLILPGGPSLEGHAVIACPSILGAVAMAINLLYANQKSFERGQFPLIAVLFVITTFAALLGILTIGR